MEPVEFFGLEAAAFKPGAVAESTRRVNTELIAQLHAKPPLAAGTPASHRALEHAGSSPFARRSDAACAEAFTISGPVGNLALRVFRGSACHGVYLHFHGGGWVLGGAAMQDGQLQHLAEHAGVTVVSVEYRLAPENPYPAAPDDCEAAALWLIEAAAARFGTSNIVLGGESAGAHLALVTALRLRDKHRYSGLRGLNLVSGMFDLRLTPRARTRQEDVDLTPDDIRWFVRHFVPEALTDRADVSPLLAELQDMPPTLVTVGTQDMLFDDAAFLYSRLLAAGTRAHIAVWPGGLHAFASLPGELGAQTQKHQAAFIRALVT